MKNLRIIFMGTPDFATETLRYLVENQLNIVAVVTTADKPAGRGQKLQECSVKKYAIEKNIPILQPTNLKNEDFLKELKNYNADLQIVVAFRMLPKVVWAMPNKGTFNLHASLLPDYRGAAPINWAIINGETETGVTTFFLDEKIDTGAMILQSKTAISPNETAETLHDKLMKQGAELVFNTIKLISEDKVQTTIQPTQSLKEAPKIHKETCLINWQKPISELDNFIRGLSPYPTAWTNLSHNSETLSVKIFSETPLLENHSYKIGQIIIENKTIKVAVSGGFIQINELQLPSKKRMTAKELLNGFTFNSDDFFF
ncbi:MAG: methionyl-tRNA formyltransferase [Capnocytophaga sp.]|nr:methionyl-tRNA formyltransferase [Capnocytophaga sp.]